MHLNAEYYTNLAFKIVRESLILNWIYFINIYNVGGTIPYWFYILVNKSIIQHRIYLLIHIMADMIQYWFYILITKSLIPHWTYLLIYIITRYDVILVWFHRLVKNSIIEYVYLKYLTLCAIKKDNSAFFNILIFQTL